MAEKQGLNWLVRPEASRAILNIFDWDPRSKSTYSTGSHHPANNMWTAAVYGDASILDGEEEEGVASVPKWSRAGKGSHCM
jgi:hypothetical protein